MLESGEYFMSQAQKEKNKRAAMLERQVAKVEERKRQREDVFVAPEVRVKSGTWRGEGRCNAIPGNGSSRMNAVDALGA
jgi:hypothetical protein